MVSELNKSNSSLKMSKIVFGIFMSAIVSISYIQLFTDDDHHHDGDSAEFLPGKVMEGLKKEFHGNVQKFHDEMGFAEWIIYFSYGIIGFITIFFTMLFYVFTIKNKSTVSHEVGTQTSDDYEYVASILQELVATTAVEDSGTPDDDDNLDLLAKDGVQELDSHHHHHRCSNKLNRTVENNNIEDYDLMKSLNDSASITGPTLEINFMKPVPKSKHHPTGAGIMLCSSFVLTNTSTPPFSYPTEYYCTRFYMEIMDYDFFDGVRGDCL